MSEKDEQAATSDTTASSAKSTQDTDTNQRETSGITTPNQAIQLAVKSSPPQDDDVKEKINDYCFRTDNPRADRHDNKIRIIILILSMLSSIGLFWLVVWIMS